MLSLTRSLIQVRCVNPVYFVTCSAYRLLSVDYVIVACDQKDFIDCRSD